MKEHNYESVRAYDNPIPKPPDELFDDFMRNTEARLTTLRFDVEGRRQNRPKSGVRDSQ